MTRKDYQPLAKIAGETLAAALESGGEETRTKVYDALYRPLVTLLADDNPRFSQMRFAAAVGEAESQASGHITAADVSAFVNQTWANIYLTRQLQRGGVGADKGMVWETLLHSVDGPRVFTLVRPDGSMRDLTRASAGHPAGMESDRALTSDGRLTLDGAAHLLGEEV
jgi:hypothetical protein